MAQTIAEALKSIGTEKDNKIPINPKLKNDSVIYASNHFNSNERAYERKDIHPNDRQTFNYLDGLKISKMIESDYIIEDKDSNRLFADTSKFNKLKLVGEKQLFAAIYCKPPGDHSEYFLCDVTDCINALNKAVELTDRNKLG